MFETEIARGVALLDEKRPGWLDTIDLDKLDLERPYFRLGNASCGCVCAQVNFAFRAEDDPPGGNYLSEIRFLAIEGAAAHHGFNFRNAAPPGEWQTLTKKWKQVIIALRAERSSVFNEATPAQEHELVTAGD